jgi:hypothetical protein
MPALVLHERFKNIHACAPPLPSRLIEARDGQHLMSTIVH